MSFISDMLSPANVCSVLSVEPHYQEQRDRVGALVHESLSYYDKYQKIRPWVFAASLAAFAGSGYFWATRGLLRRKRGYRVTEANILYPSIMALAGVAAWYTRPDGLFPPPEPRLTAKTTPANEPGFLAWIDSRVETLKQEDPRFADKALAKFVALPSVRNAWKETPEIARSLVECGRHKV